VLFRVAELGLLEDLLIPLIGSGELDAEVEHARLVSCLFILRGIVEHDLHRLWVQEKKLVMPRLVTYFSPDKAPEPDKEIRRLILDILLIL